MDIKANFKKLSAVVLKTLGKQEFDKDANGKSILSAEDKTLLGNSFTPAFLQKFEQGLEVDAALTAQESQSSAAMEQLRNDNATALQQMQEQVNAATQRADAAEAAKLVLQQTVEALSAEPEGAAEVITGPGKTAKVEAWKGIPVNQKHYHNKMASEWLKGNTGMALATSNTGFGVSNQPGMSGNTINTDELFTEFGTYLSQSKTKLEIINVLMQQTESQMYMTTKLAITEWRAASSVISSVVQQFIAKWTPSGSTEFTPRTIVNRRHKINLPILPDDINDSWLSYLYNEQVTVDQMPITRYIIEELLRPKIEEDIELKMIATGTYTALGVVNEGDAGQAPELAMDGYVTQLKAMKADGGTNAKVYTYPLDSNVINENNVVDVVEGYATFVRQQAPLYAKKGMEMFIDPDIYDMYKKRYRDLYPTTKNEDKRDDRPDFSNLKFVPLAAMTGTGVFFSTPRENFIRLIHKNAAGGETKLQLQVDNYTVKVFAEFWLAVGFAIEEVVFLYAPTPA